MLKPDPIHVAARTAFLGLNDPAEQKRRIGVTDYHSAEYVASEVLITLVRAKFGEKNGVLGAATAALYARIKTQVNRLLHGKSAWASVLASNSEVADEATSDVWVNLLDEEGALIFAEVRFGPSVENRAIDFLRKQLTELKRGEQSLESFTFTDSDGQDVRFQDLEESDPEDTPEELLNRARLASHLNDKLLELPREVRNALQLRLEYDYTWEEISELLKVTPPTARRYFKIGFDHIYKEL